ncbi:MAG: RluA family pseudouridine synthase [Bacilli bacterium]|nr:RluA family pseudouridine synthase [Bacilli bacterium]MBR2997472.1 RluA family pseudouridine synthase [Bacilli bacterium]
MRIEVITDEEERIDQYLSKNEELNLTRSKIQQLIKSGNILVNNEVVRNSYKVQDGDIIDINIVFEEMNVKGEDIPLDIVYEDDDVLVINKKSGMVVHPAIGNTSGTLVNALINYSKLSTINGEFRPGIVHRIDKDTSGLLLVAKNDKAHLFLEEELRQRKISRIYVALVSGVINHDTGEINAPIGRDKNDRKKMAVTSTNSKEAVTHFKVLERYKNSCLVECKLDTGRTHQIRVHMKYIGHPIVNDPVYGKGKNIDNYGQMLHARTLSFIHPTTKELLSFTREPDEEFNKILEIYKNE